MGAGNVISQISVQVVDAKQMDAAIEQISTVLRERHKIRYEDDFTVRSQQDMLESASAITGVLTLFLGGVAAISLVVGGIGIMNIMLVSVTERTREIGVRRALGARRSDIRTQFLIESSMISGLGGGVGIAAGIVAARVIARFAGWPTLVQPQVVLAAFVFAGMVGVFFGFYPAAKAARLDPIDALRYE
jgi:putative ABC transport system permease protein